jgi:sulfur-oxidizing protein SoxX
MNRTKLLTGGAGALVLLAGCATVASDTELDAQLHAMLKSSFRTEGIAGVDRLEQDPGQAACSTGKALPPEVAAQIEKTALASVQPPTDGKYLGDWREGEKLAQNGRGMTWSDKSAAPSANGGSCYNCHQIGKAEISFGTIGPSLYHYGKLRGVADPASPQSAQIVQYTWGKINNAWAYNACSNMPRFGHKGLLDQKQIQDVMALLLDPKSPVNAD